MLDQIEAKIANQLAQKHNYPFAQNIYINIFQTFSHFPITMSDIGIEGVGKTITYMALVVLKCYEIKGHTLPELFQKVLKELKPLVDPYFPQDCTVETFLGAALYFSHPSSIKNDLGHKDVKKMFTEKQLYEFELKKKTININIM